MMIEESLDWGCIDIPPHSEMFTSAFFAVRAYCCSIVSKGAALHKSLLPRAALEMWC